MKTVILIFALLISSADAQASFCTELFDRSHIVGQPADSVSTLFTRLSNIKLDGTDTTYFDSIRIKVVDGGPGAYQYQIAFMPAEGGKSLGYASLSREESIGTPDGSKTFGGYGMDVFFKKEHEGKGLGTLIYLLSGLYMAKKGERFHLAAHHSVAARKLWEGLERRGLARRLWASVRDPIVGLKPVEIFEFIPEKLSDNDIALLESFWNSRILP